MSAQGVLAVMDECREIVAITLADPEGAETIGEARATVAESHAALCAGYLLALQMPHNSLRIDNQRSLARMRDAIAKFECRKERDVQEEYEERALLARAGGAK